MSDFKKYSVVLLAAFMFFFLIFLVTTIPPEANYNDRYQQLMFFIVFLIAFIGAGAIIKLLGIKKIFFMIKMDDNIKFDKKEGRVFLPLGTDLLSYGDIWFNHNMGLEYMSDISIKRYLQLILTHVENLPDKTVHIENAQAKNERIARVLADLEKSKYERTKNVDETSISNN